jgi:hypothetical protein
MTDKNISIGSGDDFLQHWEGPPEVAMERISWCINLASIEGDYIDWGDVVRGSSELEYIEQKMQYADEDERQLTDLVEALGAIITYEEWDGGAPGQSGTLLNAFLNETDLPAFMKSVTTLAECLERYCQRMGWMTR